MKKIAISIFTVLSAANLFAASPCYIEAWDKILYVSKKAGSNPSIIRKSNCSKTVQKKFSTLVLGYDNTVNTHYMKLANADFFKSQNIIITPGHIEMINFNTLLSSKLGLDNKHSWTDLKVLGNKNHIGVSKSEIVTPKIQSNRLGFKNISVSITNPIAGTEKKIWLTGYLKIRSKALISNGFFNIDSQGIKENMFHMSEILTDRPEQIFANKDRLRHYRLTHPINKGEPLMVSDVIANNLVKSGMPSTIVFKSSKLALSSTAIPLRAGKFGDTIQLRSPKSKKVITGKVVDYNKVEIQL